MDNISGLLEISSGNIKIKYKDKRGFKKSSHVWQDIDVMAQFFSLVSQETILDNSSIIENITRTKIIDLTKKQINEARKLLKIVLLDEFVDSLPNNVFNKINDHGLNFSGGQRQRIAIAPAIYKKSPILLMDEFVRTLDKELEEKLLFNVFNSAMIRL